MNDFEQKYEYIKHDPISSGSYGNIYRIRDKKVKTEYVLKKLRKEELKIQIKEEQLMKILLKMKLTF